MLRIRHCALVILALVLIGLGLVACNSPYSSPGGGDLSVCATC